MNDRGSAARPDGGTTPEDQLRSNTYRLLAALLTQPPNEELVSTLREIHVDESEQSNAMAAAWKTLAMAARRTELSALDDEYHDLFIGIGRGEVVPYASWYLTGFMMEQPLVQLRQDLKRLGFARQEDVKEPEDHAGALYEIMALLIESAPEVTLHQQRAFFDQHLAPWIAKFFGDLQQAKSASFYSAVGALGEQFMELDRHHLEMLPH